MSLFKLTTILFVGLILLLMAQRVSATQITVAKDGEVTSVQAGIDQAQPDDTGKRRTLY